MKLNGKPNQPKELFADRLPQAIHNLKHSILTPFFGADLNDKYANEKSPYRAELFTIEQMETYAQRLAGKHTLIEGPPSEQLLKRLAENESILLEVHQLLGDNVREGNRIVPAGEWLLDNFYLIEEQIYTGKKHLPKGYSKGLPQLAKGASEGLPRVYDMAVEIISHSDGRVDLESLIRFVQSYQTVMPLKLGELWAVPIMLRLALLENLRRLATQIALDILNKNVADYWADEMIETAKTDPKSLVLVIADMARSNPPMESAFVAELTRRLNDKGAALTLPLTWIEQRLSENGLTSSELVQLENQKQAADQVSISNSISSLRFLNTTDWRDFVEDTSVVERILSEDHAGVYNLMDFHTRDAYRHVVERTAKYSKASEAEVAIAAMDLAKEHLAANIDIARRAHVGYFLMGKGFEDLCKRIQPNFPVADRLKKAFNKAPFFGYSFLVTLIALLLSWLLIKGSLEARKEAWQIVVLALVCMVAVSQFALSIINWMVTLIARPSLLPRMNFSKGIPQAYSTLVVVPTLLTSMDDVEHLAEGLEVRYLANRNAYLHFALLTDFSDAATENLPEDDALINGLKQRMEELNEKYQSPEGNHFFLFHRPRTWNEREKKWMGYERKRGKLSALNALLQHNDRSAFSVIVGDAELFQQIKYVITLDTDTQLPRDAAWKMVGTMAHPLNKALYSQKHQRVIDGYGILQPRVSNSLPPANASLFSKLNSNEPGTDPYTRAISDVYQDLFEEGSFIGKGIYEIASFEVALNGRFPDNRILSHDLVEGCYARAGLLSDVQLYEAYPSSYFADMKRRHRWIRGDWQIARWLFPHVPAPEPQFKRNPLTPLSRWKIFDNLRRSLVPQCLLLMLLYGWMISTAPWFWTFTVLGILTSSTLLTMMWELAHKPATISLVAHVSYTLRSFVVSFIHHSLDFIFLPYEAWINTDAILRTGWRMFISKKHLLEWNPSSTVSRLLPQTIVASYAAMWQLPLFGTAVLCWVFWRPGMELLVQVPVIICWILAPAIAWLISKLQLKRRHVITAGQTVYLQQLARKIWAFFEDFVVKDDHWLPPDNYQEHPGAIVAHRTSPTNIGLSLLANLTAYDFGYISMGYLLERTSQALDTIRAMEKYKGHLYNWYDTLTLAPLPPRYVSTVDTGNFVGHLITLKQGLLLLQQQPVFSARFFAGLLDTVAVLLERDGKQVVIQQFKKELESIRADAPETLFELKHAMDRIAASYHHVIASFSKQEAAAATPEYHWVEKLGNQIHDANQELTTLMPWILLDAPDAETESLLELVNQNRSLKELSVLPIDMLPAIRPFYKPTNSNELNEWLDAFVNCIINAGKRAKERLQTIESLTATCQALSTVEYDFIFDKNQQLFSIGYNAEEHRRDNSFYDLLASEARLSTFVAIAQGKLPQESWFALGRQLTNTESTPILLSWSGSMFEYLMPALVMPSYDNTILDQTHKAVVAKQIEYGNKRGIPWGISESGYNLVDASMNYQYKAFGVPGLGLKRGLAEDLVISPYATVMALMMMPGEACANLAAMRQLGFEGDYGFYEAVDYTASRLPRGKTNVVIRSFMAHHQGMSFLSLSHLLLDQPMQQRFESEVQFQSALLLLQEKIPRVSSSYSPGAHTSEAATVVVTNDSPIRVVNTAHTALPEVQLLSNGRYNVMVTNAGGGYSRWKDIAVTRWREDVTCDEWGSFCFIRDLESQQVWSASYQPALQESEMYEAVFSQGRAEFRRKEHQMETHTEIVVSPEDDVELRRIHLTNRSRKRRVIELTSYAEVVLTTANADNAHTAFSNLFVETEIVPARNAIVCNRRPRTQHEQTPSMFHLMKVHYAGIDQVTYETDRSKFIGRGNSIHHPQKMYDAAPLSNTEGPVLDPVIAIQYRITIEPQQTAVIDLVMGIADTRATCNSLVEKYQDKHLTDRGFELSWTHSQVVLRQINAVETDAQLFGRLASSVVYANQSLRADPDIITRNFRGQAGLWSYSISGDLPIVLVQIEDSANIELVKQLIQAHAYWRLKGLMVDLVIWNDDHGGYRQNLQSAIANLVVPTVGMDVKEQPGGIFIRSTDQISNEDRILFQTVARIIIADRFGTLEEQLNRRDKMKSVMPYFSPSKFYPSLPTQDLPLSGLQFFNGIGGFAADGKEYVISTTQQRVTPTPWINVLANKNFGTIVSESGQSYSWLGNAHEYRLSTWNNDPVCDLAGEVFYLRDEESGKFWSPTPLQSRGKSAYITRHGFGYSVFEHTEDGLRSELTMFVDLHEPVKFFVLKLYNTSGRKRRMSVTGYVEWVLADLRSKSQMHIVTQVNSQHDSILATNAYNSEFAGKTAFFDVDEGMVSFTADRTEFIGRNGLLRNPEAMHRSKLSGRYGAGLDPCAALQCLIELADEGEKEIIFKLGAGNDHAHALELIQQFTGSANAYNALKQVKAFWQQTLGVVQIQTPDAALNILANGWLTYQSQACRLWARSGFYQSGGAFGFRDQLQDVLSLLHNQPALVREQVLLHASRQFAEGDVQHWWHPPSGRGVRTTCSDDYLWLPFVTARYVIHTGDDAILDESIGFLESRLLNEGEESNYDLPGQSNQSANLYQHCVKAIEYGLRFGVHGLPLMGSGDWNDGMDKVGEHGKGESVWLAFFLYDVLIRFAEIARIRNDEAMALRCMKEAGKLKQNLEAHAWDGAWYRRAYFDDGTPLGSKTNEECQIDSIAQSWSVLSGAGDPKKVVTAMQSAGDRLIKKDIGIIQLFDPPFDQSALYPGYIKGYVPGVRENGGQYTHAAIWLVMAYAALKDKAQTWQLLQMINPVNRGKDAASIDVYKVEPYVMAADVYAVSTHRGRGGWTWYTGSAGWMYQLVIERVMGLKRRGDELSFDPCLPDEWANCSISYGFMSSRYQVHYKRSEQPGIQLVLDQVLQPNAVVTLVDDGAEHVLQVLIGV